MKKGVVIYISFFLSLSTYAQTQEGIVRTSGSVKKKGTELQGVIIRPVGGNDVMSQADGSFSMVLQQHLPEGNSFQLAKVYKKGYEPIDKNILSRQFVYSKSAPIEIVLISTKQLTKTKADIETKARNNAEKRCRKQMSDLKKRFDAQQISNIDYQKKKQELEKQLKTFEVLIAAMADHYARTDYNKLDSLNATINECIVNGELEKADSLINTKGDVKKRANENIIKGKRLHEAENLLDSVTNVIQQQ